jgi:hypothetical protein
MDDPAEDSLAMATRHVMEGEERVARQESYPREVDPRWA